MDASQNGASATPSSTSAAIANSDQPSSNDDMSFFDNLGIPKMDEFAISKPAILPEAEPDLSETDAKPTITEASALTPAADETATTLESEEAPVPSIPHPDSSDDVMRKSILQQNLQEDKDSDEEKLEVQTEDQVQVGLVKSEPVIVGDVPDTNEIGFKPEPFEGLGVAEDPFEKLRRDSISHTSSFPAVPDPQTTTAEAPSDPFGGDPAGDDSFFANAGAVEKPVEASDSNFFGDEGGAGDDFFANVGPNGVAPIPTLERSETADPVMGGDVVAGGEDNQFTEGLPLFSGEAEPADDFFSRSRTPIDPLADDDDTAFFDDPAAFKRKSTTVAAGITETEPNPALNPPQTDIASAWGAALGDDMLDDETEEDDQAGAVENKAAAPAWFNDDEDFLFEEEDNNGAASNPMQSSASRPQPTTTQSTSRYAPSNIQTQPYTPNHAGAPVPSPAAPSQFTPAASPFATVFQTHQRPTGPPKAQSFVDKTSGYASPYDLPDDIVKTVKKKPAPVQQPPAYIQGQSYGAQGSLGTPLSGQGVFGSGPPSSGLGPPAEIRGRPGYGSQPGAPPQGPPSRGGVSPAPNAVPPKTLKSQSSGFFEELPITLPKRSTSSMSGRYTPGARAPSGGPPPTAPISMNRTPSMGGPPSRPTSVEPGYAAPPVGSLGVPNQYGTSPAPPIARSVSPYAAPPGSAGSNYTPKPSGSLYASPPSAVRGTSPYAPRPNATPPSAVSGQPRSASTSSEHQYRPISGHESVGLGLSGTPDGGANSHSATGRPPSRDRPGTMDSMKAHALGGVAEEDEDGNAPSAPSFNKALPPPPSAASSRYAPSSSQQSTPPPGSQGTLSRLASPPPRNQSPGKYTPSTYQTHTATSSLSSTVLSPTDTTNFAPPKRSATQSPGFAAFRTSTMSGIQRPSSAAATHATTYSSYSPVDARRQSYPVQQTQAPPPPQNFMAPPPGSLAAADPLERWKGTPLFCWGFGGSITTMFPVHTNRWNAETGQQVVKTSLGEVKIRPAKDVLKEDELFEDSLKFPGPVFGGRAGGKARKKEISTWMEGKILKLEGEYTRYRDARSLEKVILWKVVKLCLDNDGLLGGKKEIDEAVRQIISPESETAEIPAPRNALQQSTVYDRNALDSIKTHLLKGDREAAVWFAIENRQWAHAILISSTTSPDLYKRAVQEFVRQEVKSVEGVDRPGMESLAVLYEVFAGNWEESIDDLIPASTRMGMTMMSTTGGNSNANAMESLEKWRETLGMMLSNRSSNDIQAIAKLGTLLESYNRIEAAHICYLFAVPAAIFSGAEESSKTIFSLLGANHVNNPFNYGRDLDAIILSEIYEYALSLIPGAPTLTTVPHLLPFKLHHAHILTQYGFKAEAQKYTEAIAASFKLTNRPQPYIHPLLLSTIDELNKRLSQAPRDSSSGSWMSKPTLDNISSGLLSKFNKFVAGDDDSEKEQAALGGGINGGINGGDVEGPFAKLANTPDLSRIQSGTDLYGAAMGGYTPYNPAQPPLGVSPASMAPKATGAAASRYAPKSTGAGGYIPQQPQMTSPPAESASPAYGGYGGYEPQQTPSYGGYGGYDPNPQSASFQPAEQPAENSNGYGGYQPSPVPSAAPPMAPPMTSPSFDSGYQSFTPTTISAPAADDAQTTPQTAGFEPPSSGGYDPTGGAYGYEPPNSFQPYVPSPDNSDDEGEKKSKGKKKGIMDDDNDFGAGKNATAGGAPSTADAAKRKQEEEEENRKMVAEIAEREKKEAEEAKKAAKAAGWFGGWFGGKKDPNMPVVHKAKLGEDNQFVYDPDLKKWVNKKGGAPESAGGPSGTPPPPKRFPSPAPPMSGPPSGPGTPRPGTSSSMESSSGPPRPPGSAPPTSAPTSGGPPSGGLMPPPPAGSAASRDPSPNRPPPRPATTGKVDDMEELLGSTGSVRKGASKAKGRKRYVEVL